MKQDLGLRIPIMVVLVLMLAHGCSAPPPLPGNSAQERDWRRVESPTPVNRGQPLRAGFLIVDGVYNTELTAPFDVFHHTPFHTSPRAGIEVFTVSPNADEVTSFEGLRLRPDYTFQDAPPIDILVVPSAEGSMDRDLKNEAMINWVREVGDRARYVVSLCDGAFVLAAAGLLEGHRCTTFPGDQDRFAEMFPRLDLQREVSFVHDGRILTSQGGAKSFDVAMHLVDHLYGEAVAQGVGRGLIIPWPPGPGELPALVVDPTSR